MSSVGSRQREGKKMKREKSCIFIMHEKWAVKSAAALAKLG